MSTPNTPPHTLSSSSSPSRPGRKAKRSVDPAESGQKPKKVNSEIRKQQNRIASRNYREKRKRKLQLLQQIISDQGQSTPSPPESAYDPYEMRHRSVSTEIHYSEPMHHSQSYSPNMHYSGLPLTSANSIDPVLAATTTTGPYDTHLLPTSQPYLPQMSPGWDAPIYEPSPPQMPMHQPWGAPVWMQSPPMEYAQLQPQQANYHYSPDLHHALPYETIPMPSLAPQTHVTSSDYILPGSLGRCKSEVPQSHSQMQRAPDYYADQRSFTQSKQSIYI